MHDYENLKAFWNACFTNLPIEKIEGKWVEDETFNNVVRSSFKDGSNILDYGTGSGWALFELAFTINNIKGIGIDTALNGIEHANKVVKESDLNNLHFVCGDESILSNYQNYFDGAISINLVDVIPDEIIESVLSQIYKSLKENAFLIIGINPSFPEEFLKQIGFEKKGHYLYKNGILRGNEKTNDEWNALFSRYFKVVDVKTFALTDREKDFPRRMFILQK